MKIEIEEIGNGYVVGVELTGFEQYDERRFLPTVGEVQRYCQEAVTTWADEERAVLLESG